MSITVNLIHAVEVTTTMQPESNDITPLVGGTVGGVVAVLCVFLIILVILVFCVRKRQSKDPVEEDAIELKSEVTVSNKVALENVYESN